MKPIQKAAVAALIVAIILIAAMGITAFAYHPMNTVMSDQGPVNHKDLPYYNTTVNGKKKKLRWSISHWLHGGRVMVILMHIHTTLTVHPMVQ